MTGAPRAGWQKNDRLHIALGTSLALHLAVAAWFSSLPTGSMGGGSVAAIAGGERIRAILRGLPSAPAIEARRTEISDQVTPERPARNSAATQARAGLPADSARPGAGPGPDSYTSVETHTAIYSPVNSYLPVGDLDIRPWITVHVEPEYPEAAARRFLAGKVVIRVLINEQGKVDRAMVVSSEPPGFFELAVQTAFNAARYTPGVKMGKAVKSQLLIEVSFASSGPPRVVELQH